MNLKISEIVAGVAPSVDIPQPTATKRSAPKRKQAHESKTKRQAKPKQAPKTEVPEIEAELDRHSETEVVAHWALENTPDEVGVEQVGAWIWLTFPEKPEAEMRAKLKANGFRWSPRRKQWAHACGVFTGKSKSDAHPRAKYGSVAMREDED